MHSRSEGYRGKNRTDGSVVDTATMRMGMARVTPYLYQCLSDVELLCLKLSEVRVI